MTAHELEQLLADLERSSFPQHIDALPVKNKIKRAFTLYERAPCSQPWGLIPSMDKESAAAWKSLAFKKRYAVTRIMQTNIWWAFFFGPFYYFCAGLWRKGLVLSGGLLLLGLAIGMLFYVVTGQEVVPRSLNFGITFGIAYTVSMMAAYDLYRLKVKRQVFWW